MTGRENLLVELTDESGAAIGACTVAEAHAAPGRRHRAFSVLLYDHSGQILLQRRAPVKSRFACRWSNTCCGHPAPRQDPALAAVRRLSDEMGIDPGHITPLTEIGVFRYEAADPDSGLVERECDHILIATLTGGCPEPDASEVSDYAWISSGSLRDDLAHRPDAYTPWLPGVLDIAVRAVLGAGPDTLLPGVAWTVPGTRPLVATPLRSSTHHPGTRQPAFSRFVCNA